MPVPGSAVWAWALVSPASEWAGTRASGCVGGLSGVCLFAAVTAAASWPVLVSVAGGGRVKETTEVVHEAVDGDLSHPIPVSG